MNKDSYTYIKQILFKRSTFLLCGILLIGIFFRLYNTPDRFGFDQDPTRDALIAIYGAEQFQIPLIGPASGIANFTFGPWYYYELILVKLLFKFDYAPFYLISFHSILFIILMYILGRSLKDPILGLILAYLAAISPGQTGPSAGLSNPNLIPMHAVLTCIIFLQLWKNQKKWWLSLIWGLTLGIGINHHYQIAALFLLPLIFYIRSIKLYVLHIIAFIGGLIIAFIPLLIFNYIFDLHTFYGVINYLRFGSGLYVPNSWTIYIKDFWPDFWSYMIGIPVWYGVSLGLFALFTHFYLLYKHKLSEPYIYLLCVFASIIFMLRYYSGVRDYYYLLFIHPLLFLFAGYPLWILFKLKFGRFICIALLLSIFIFAFPLNLQRLADRNDHISFRNDVNSLIGYKSNTTYTVYSCGNRFDSKVMGTVFLLHNRNKLSSNGVKVGINTDNSSCILPNSTIKITSDIYNINELSDKQLENDGWIRVGIEDVYKKYLQWWEK